MKLSDFNIYNIEYNKKLAQELGLEGLRRKVWNNVNWKAITYAKKEEGDKKTLLAITYLFDLAKAIGNMVVLADIFDVDGGYNIFQIKNNTIKAVTVCMTPENEAIIEQAILTQDLSVLDDIKTREASLPSEGVSLTNEDYDLLLNILQGNTLEEARLKRIAIDIVKEELRKGTSIKSLGFTVDEINKINNNQWPSLDRLVAIVKNCEPVKYLQDRLSRDERNICRFIISTLMHQECCHGGLCNAAKLIRDMTCKEKQNVKRYFLDTSFFSERSLQMWREKSITITDKQMNDAGGNADEVVKLIREVQQELKNVRSDDQYLYIFLDFDGVLNTERYQSSEEYSSCIFEREVVLHFLGWLRKLKDYKIVISSSWKIEGVEKIKEWLNPYGFPVDKIVGVTSNLKSRDEEILEFVNENEIKDYLVIDDYEYELKGIPRDKLALTDSSIGFREGDVKK
jgi:hypothetical protein